MNVFYADNARDSSSFDGRDESLLIFASFGAFLPSMIIGVFKLIIPCFDKSTEQRFLIIIEFLMRQLNNLIIWANNNKGIAINEH